MDEMDYNSDGVIGFDEFKAYVVHSYLMSEPPCALLVTEACCRRHVLAAHQTGVSATSHKALLDQWRPTDPNRKLGRISIMCGPGLLMAGSERLPQTHSMIWNHSHQCPEL